jgi:ketosteroid isomerase-like protein
MSQENLELVRLVFEAFNSEDIERIVAFTHPELEVEVPPELSAEPDTYRGPDGIRRYFRSFQEVMDEIRFEPEQLWDAGDSVVVALRLTAKGRQTAIPVEQRTAGVWTIRDGKVMRIRAYRSPSEALEAAGVSE